MAGCNVIGSPNRTIWSRGDAISQRKRRVTIARMKKGKLDRQKHLCPAENHTTPGSDAQAGNFMLKSSVLVCWVKGFGETETEVKN